MIVYLITNTKNGKLYVGATKHPLNRRWREHCKAARAGLDRPLQTAIREDGETSFNQRILARPRSQKGMDKSEREWIKSLNCQVPFGYNITSGGDRHIAMIGNQHAKGNVLSPLTRQRMSLAKKGKPFTEAHKQAMRHPKSEETKAKMRHPKSPEHRAKLAMINRARAGLPTKQP